MRYAPGTSIDRFELIEELGEGAFAETYLARDTANGQLVVLKSPNPTLLADPAIFQRYKRESEIARSISHPGVQRAVDSGEVRTEAYLVLEYVEGENLRTHVVGLDGSDGWVEIELALDWGHQVADALVYLHAHGIVHRDLKPENILVTAKGELKIADFGTALLDGAKRLTWKHLSDGIGTPSYMSPEQIQGERGDDRSDIYAWGVMMYEFLTGRVPFRGDNWMATMAGHLTKAPESIRSQRKEVSPALEAVVLTAMRRFPDHRYQSAQQLLTDLDRLDQLDAAAFDLSPEAPMGAIAAVEGTKRLWILVAAVAVGFVAAVALTFALSVWL